MRITTRKKMELKRGTRIGLITVAVVTAGILVVVVALMLWPASYSAGTYSSSKVVESPITGQKWSFESGSGEIYTRSEYISVYYDLYVGKLFYKVVINETALKEFFDIDALYMQNGESIVIKTETAYTTVYVESGNQFSSTAFCFKANGKWWFTEFGIIDSAQINTLLTNILLISE